MGKEYIRCGLGDIEGPVRIPKAPIDMNDQM
jgi:hypothetical protein